MADKQFVRKWQIAAESHVVDLDRAFVQHVFGAGNDDAANKPIHLQAAKLQDRDGGHPISSPNASKSEHLQPLSTKSHEEGLAPKFDHNQADSQVSQSIDDTKHAPVVLVKDGQHLAGGRATPKLMHPNPLPLTPQEDGVHLRPGFGSLYGRGELALTPAPTILDNVGESVNAPLALKDFKDDHASTHRSDPSCKVSNMDENEVNRAQDPISILSRATARRAAKKIMNSIMPDNLNLKQVFVEDGEFYKDVDMSALEPIVRHWAKAHPEFPVATLVEGHADRDVDTNTGNFMEPLSHDHTVKNPEDIRGEMSKSFQYISATANGMVDNEIKARAQLRATIEARVAAMHQQLEKERLDKLAAVHVAPASPALDLEPHVACILRPARVDDMQAVADIYNHEVKHGYQTVDTHLVTVSQFRTRLGQCQGQKMPFIVAIKSREKPEDLDPTSFPSERIWREFVRLKKAQAEQDPDVGKVLGFAFLSEHSNAIARRDDHAGRYTAQVRLHVHPEYRRMNIGNALMDRILDCSNGRHHRGYHSIHDWECQEGRDGYKQSKDNTRRFMRLIIETHHKHGIREENDVNLQWMNKFLRMRYGFQPMVRLDCVRRTHRGFESEWLDTILWKCDSYDVEDAVYFLDGNYAV